MEDSRWPDKSAAKRARQRLAYERVFSEWRDVLRVVQKDDWHPSPEYLADLIQRYGVPDFAREYVANRQTNPLPKGPPIALPRRPTTYEELELAIASGRFRSTGTVGIVSDGLTGEQYRLVRAVRRRHARYRAFETTNEMPNKIRSGNLPLLRHVKSRGVWVVRGPKARALKKVAGREKEATVDKIREWEKQLGKGLREGWSRGRPQPKTPGN